MLERVRRGLWGISRRVVASYVLVAVVVVVLIEVFVLGYQVPRLFDQAQLHAQVNGTAESFWNLLTRRYPSGVPDGALLGDRRQRPDPGTTQTTPDGSILVVPAVAATVRSRKAVTAVVALAEDGRIIASSVPSRYPSGRSAAGHLPAAATAAIRAGLLKGVPGGTGSTAYGAVSWTLYAGSEEGTPPTADRPFSYLYVQAPEPTGFVDPIQAWEELGKVSGSGPFATISDALLLVFVPIVVLLGLLSSRRLLRRVRRLERVSVAVAGGDYTVTLPASGHDDVGRLESNFASIAQQLRSAVLAERERATGEARAAERARIAREIHDAISQHLFGLRMIASGMRRAEPHNEQVRAIERITEDALRDMRALLLELRPTAGLAPALEQICSAYRDRLGVSVDASIADVTVPESVEHALLRVTQEACTNAVRHGKAQRLAVSMARRDGQVEVTVRDDGTGFDPAVSRVGSGLTHMCERVTELGGTVDIESAPGSGTAVTVRVPAS